MAIRLNSGNTLETELARRREFDQGPHTVRWVIGELVAQRWHQTYSGDFDCGGGRPSPLRGSVEIGGRRYVCMGSVGTGADGDFELTMVELLEPEEYSGPGPVSSYERFDSEPLLRSYGRNHYGIGPVRIKRDRSGQDYVLGWDWEALVGKMPPEGILEVGQADLFAQGRPFPAELDEDAIY